MFLSRCSLKRRFAQPLLSFLRPPEFDGRIFMAASKRARDVRVGEHRFVADRSPDGVIELRSDDELGLAAGLGWAHATDRLVQMLLLRLVCQGRLGECLQATDETLAIDIWAREMGFAHDVARDEELCGAEARRVAEAYAAGVNQVLARRRRPFELVLVGYRPEPWRLADTLTTIKVMTYVGLAQTQEDFERLLIQALRDGVPVDSLRRLTSPHLDGLDADTVAALADLRWLSPLLPPEVRFAAASARASASNNWAVAPGRSATGSALFASDPHMEVNRLPALWYEAVLHSGEDYRLGITMPGVPGVVMGRTRHVAYGFTYGFMDMVDFFIEEVRSGAVRRGDGWVPLEVRHEQIRRKKREPLAVTIRENDLGVLEADPRVAHLDDGYYLTRAWSARRGGAAPSLDAIVRMPRVRTVNEAQQVLRTITISCNWVIADRDGNIGYQQSGRLPDRMHSGLHPLPAWEPSNHWRGWVPPEQLLTILNPPEGFLATANNELNPSGGPLTVNLPMGNYRVDRIQSVLAATESAEVGDMKRLQNDLYSIQAERFMELLRPLLPELPAADLLRRWDLRYDADSQGATVFEQVYHRLLARVFGDGLFGNAGWQAIVEASTVLADFYHLFDNAIFGGDSCWFGDQGRDEVLRQVLEEVLTDLDPTTIPRWGATHRVLMTDIFFGGKLPRWLGFDHGPIELVGNRATVVQGGLLTAHGRLTTFAPSWRIVTDLATDRADTVLAGGPTGSRFSRHRLTDVDRWLAGEYKTLGPHR
jgi:penicillin amidase